MDLIKNRVALVTGAAKGLGAAIAKTLANAGASVVVNYRNSKDEAEAIVSEIQKKGGKAIALQADVTKKEEVRKLFDTIEKELGPVTLLVNNVGDFHYKPMNETTAEEIHAVFHSNVLSAAYCLDAALPGMKKAKQGDIINIGTSGCDQIVVTPLTTPYYAAKNALYTLSQAWAKTYRTGGIYVNMLSLGPLETSVARPDDFKGELISLQEVCDILLGFFKPEANLINGAYLEVAHGWKPGSHIPSEEHHG